MKFFLAFYLFSTPLIYSMHFDIPAIKEASQKGRASQEYIRRLKEKFLKHFDYDLHISYATKNPDDWKSTIIKRFVETVMQRSFVIRNPDFEKHFKKLYKNPEAVNHLWSPAGRKLNQALAVDKDAREALRSILADRALMTYILRGTSDQPLLMRPEFDQEWSKIRRDIKEKETVSFKIGEALFSNVRLTCKEWAKIEPFIEADESNFKNNKSLLPTQQQYDEALLAWFSH